MATEAGPGGGGGSISDFLGNVADRFAPEDEAEATSDDPTGVLAEFGIDLGSLQESALPMQDIFESALASAAMEVSGIDMFTYGQQALPHWFPKELREYATPGGGLEGVYDPYYGFMDNQGDDKVYIGSQMKTVREKPDLDVKPGMEGKLYGDAYATPKGEKKREKRDDVMSFQQAVNLPYLWDEDEINDAMKKMREAGIPVTSFDQLTQVWGGLVERASKTYTLSQGDKKVSPWDVLELSKREAEAAGTLTNFESGTQTRTATSVAEISEGASWQVLQSTLSQLLGRDPSDREVRDYMYRMNTLAAKNPSITETVTRYQAGEAVATNSTTKGGFDASDMAQDAYEGAQADPEYAKVQAGTTYYNALLQGIGAVGEV